WGSSLQKRIFSFSLPDRDPFFQWSESWSESYNLSNFCLLLYTSYILIPYYLIEQFHPFLNPRNQQEFLPSLQDRERFCPFLLVSQGTRHHWQFDEMTGDY